MYDPTTCRRFDRARCSSFSFVRAGFAPGGFFVERCFGEVAQRAHRAAVHQDRGRRHLGAGWLLQERHELVRKSRHGAADADAADVGATADAVHPAALRNVAVDHGTPAPELDDALW